jgi:serine phosphatase RsbU (regulator of sigma subunit)
MFDAASPAAALLVLFSVLLLLTLAEAGRQRRRLERVIQGQREQAAYISGELEAAKRIQAGYLPRADALAGEARVEVAAAMVPAREVGGDLYDFFKLDANRLFCSSATSPARVSRPACSWRSPRRCTRATP